MVGCSANSGSGKGKGEAVRSMLSRMRAGTCGGLCLKCSSGTESGAPESPKCRRLLVLLDLMELLEESSDTGVRREVRKVSLVRVLKRFRERGKRLPLTVLATDRDGEGALSGDLSRSCSCSLVCSCGKERSSKSVLRTNSLRKGSKFKNNGAVLSIDVGDAELGAEAA